MPMFGADGLKLRPGARSILDPGLGSQQSNVGSAFPPPFSANPGWAINERGATAFPGLDLSSLPTADTALPTMPARKPGFFARNGAGVDLLGGAFDGLATALGGQAMYGPARTFARQQERADATLREANARQDAQRLQERQWSVEDHDAKMNAPQYFMAGHDRVRLDPTTGASEVVYDAPEDYEAYAGTLGFQPGDNGYQGAVQDYVLRGAGPTAIAGRESLEGVRQGNRMALRQTPTYRETHPRRGGEWHSAVLPRLDRRPGSSPPFSGVSRRDSRSRQHSKPRWITTSGPVVDRREAEVVVRLASRLRLTMPSSLRVRPTSRLTAHVESSRNGWPVVGSRPDRARVACVPSSHGPYPSACG